MAITPLVSQLSLQLSRYLVPVDVRFRRDEILGAIGVENAKEYLYYNPQTSQKNLSVVDMNSIEGISLSWPLL